MSIKVLGRFACCLCVVLLGILALASPPAVHYHLLKKTALGPAAGRQPVGPGVALVATERFLARFGPPDARAEVNMSRDEGRQSQGSRRCHRFTGVPCGERQATIRNSVYGKAGRLLLIRQERIPIREALWEFPAGQIDSPEEKDDAAIRATAERELREESGYELGPQSELIAMGCFFSSPGFTDEHSYLFLARGVVPSPLDRQRPTLRVRA